ncbi:MAG: type II toxin-antitoxin system VapC family toxin [Bacteroidia bacterium]|nr:type II toxin-antitoxin system VapC family toxin [Bacteroidia bacterium]
MACIDTSVLIDYYRKNDKSKSLFYKLTKTYSLFMVSVITEYEIYIGNTTVEQEKFWNDFFKRVTVLPYDTETNKIAVKIYNELKLKNKLIDIPDILIAATAIKNKLGFATLNRKHFDRIDSLKMTIIE